MSPSLNHVFRLSASIAASAFIVSACSSPLLEIKTPNNNEAESLVCKPNENLCNVPGIPFYRVRYQCVHESRWLEPIALVTLKISATDKSSPFAPRVLTKILNNDDMLGRDPAVKARAVLAKIQQNPGVDSFEDIWKEFSDLKDSSVLPGDISSSAFATEGTPEGRRFVMVANSVSAKRYVDFSKTYYLNGTRPWAGSANVEADLAEDGTLTKGSGQGESKTAETLLGLFPFSDVIKDAIVKPQTDGAKPFSGKSKQPKYILELKIERKVFEVIKSAQIPAAKLNPLCPAVSGFAGANGEQLVSYSFKEIGSGDGATAKGKDREP